MAQAQTIEPTNFDEINFQITSKENPDAYIESRFVPGNSAYARSSEEDGKTLVGYVDATVYVEETYTKGEDGNIFTTDSRLLSEEEVMSIGKSKFDVPVQSVQPRISTIGDKTTSRGKLTIRFTVMAYSQARRYQLNLTSNWSGLSWLSTGDTNSPGWGDDIMGFAWGGGYDFDGYGYDLLDAFGNHGRAAYIQSKANCGVAWNFNEHTTEAEYDDYITRAQCWTNMQALDGLLIHAQLSELLFFCFFPFEPLLFGSGFIVGHNYFLRSICYFVEIQIVEGGGLPL